MVYSEGIQDEEKEGTASGIAKVHIKGIISLSPNSCIFPYIEKHQIYQLDMSGF